MKFASVIALFITLTGLFTSCGDTYYDEFYDEAGYYEAMPTSGGNGRVQMIEVKDPKTGEVAEMIPLPKGWEISNEGWKGPDGMEVRAYALQKVPSNRGNVSLDELIQKDLIPQFQQQGYQVVGTLDLPEVSRHDANNYAKYWQALPAKNIVEAKGIEFNFESGEKGLAIVHFIGTRSQYGNSNAYYTHLLYGPAKGYEQAKKDILFALANYQINPQRIAAHNAREQQKSQVSWNRHNDKMRRNQIAFDSWQKTSNTLSDVNDIYYEGWKRREAISDRGHSNYIDGIWERQNVYNPQTGTTGKVDAGYNNYYMNSNGEYIGTNDAFYNPNMDPNVNNYNWTEAQEYYGY
jgi:hypothetical protein